MPGTGLHINLLGSLEVVRGGQAIEFPPSRKTRALLAYLVATGRKHSRKHLCDLLWEGPADPRAALRWSLSKIRPLLNDKSTERIITGRDNSIKFLAEGAEADLFYIQSLKEYAADPIPLEDLEHAVSLFRGAFLENCDIPECYRFSAWLDGRREDLARLHNRLFSTLIDRLQDKPEKAIHYARRLLQFDPYDEKAHIRLIRLLGKSGDREKALDQYNLCCAMLKEELNARPSTELEQTRISLIQSGVPPDGKKSEKNLTRSPIIGRSEEQEQVNRIIRQAEEHAATEMILITGEPGIGKTRLLQNIKEQVTQAEGAGAALWGGAYYLEMSRLYAPWAELLEKIRPDAIPPTLRKRLAPLLPSAASDSSGGDRNRLFNAVLELLQLLSSGKKPLAILFDNLHWFDDPSLALLHYINRETRGSNIIIACSARSAELEENTHAFRLVQALQREKYLRHLSLSPLTVSETEALMKTIDPDVNAQEAYQICRGNPLFAREMAYALKTGNDTLPDSLLNLIGDRLALLNPHTKNLLNWIAVWGYGFSLKLLSAASDYPLSQLLSSIETMERYNIIRAGSGQSYNFVHELVQNVAYRNLSESKREMIHRRIAQVMMKHENPDNDRSATILYHADRGKDDALIARACLNAGRRALEVFAYEEAAKLAEKGLNHLEKFSNDQKGSLNIKLLSLYTHPGMTSFRKPNLMEQLKECVGEARRSRQNTLVRTGLFLIANLHYQQGNFHSALERAVKAEEAGRLADPVTMIRAIADTAKCFGMVDREIDRAETLALEARSLAVEMDLESSLYEIPMALALVNHHRGRYNEAVRLYHQAIKAIRKDEGQWWKCYNLQRLPMIELERGRPADALDQCRRLLPVAQKMGEGSEAPFARALEALTHFHMGDPEAAQKLDQELETLRQIDSKWMIAWLQILAAEHDLACGNLPSARKRAEEAKNAASLIDRISEKTWASSVLIRLYIKEGKQQKAKELFVLMQKDLPSSHTLSARAARSLEETDQLVSTKN